MSTNDQVTLLASGASGVTPDVEDFTAALTEVCRDLARQLQADAEGASHDIAIEVVHAVCETDAVEVGRSVARNNLFKAAIFGNDPNWGRVLAAIGTTSADLRPVRRRRLDERRPRLQRRRARPPARRRRPRRPRAVHVLIDLKVGEAHGHDPHQRPHARLRAREQRLREL